jgi:hypothetical protein
MADTKSLLEQLKEAKEKGEVEEKKESGYIKKKARGTILNKKLKEAAYGQNFRSGGRVCKIAKRGKGKAYGKNS